MKTDLINQLAELSLQRLLTHFESGVEQVIREKFCGQCLTKYCEKLCSEAIEGKQHVLLCAFCGYCGLN